MEKEIMDTEIEVNDNKKGIKRTLLIVVGATAGLVIGGLALWARNRNSEENEDVNEPIEVTYTETESDIESTEN